MFVFLSFSLSLFLALFIIDSCFFATCICVCFVYFFTTPVVSLAVSLCLYLFLLLSCISLCRYCFMAFLLCFVLSYLYISFCYLFRYLCLSFFIYLCVFVVLSRVLCLSFSFLSVFLCLLLSVFLLPRLTAPAKIQKTTRKTHFAFGWFRMWSRKEASKYCNQAPHQSCSMHPRRDLGSLGKGEMASSFFCQRQPSCFRYHFLQNLWWQSIARLSQYIYGPLVFLDKVIS